jgi:pimeloyl-ACP methyl ester carboxylesterase
MRQRNDFPAERATIRARRPRADHEEGRVPHVSTDDGVALNVEETGQGLPVLFLHEFAGDHRSWEPQVRALSRRYRCITYDARGYPPSDVPEDPAAYSQGRAVDDAIAVLDALGVAQAHVVGLSMGGFATLHLGLRHPDRARSLVVAACGYGAQPERQDAFRRESATIAGAFASEGAAEVAKRYAVGPARVQFQNKDPRGWAEFAAQLAEHSSEGSALTMRGVQGARPSLYDLTGDLERLTVPMLIVAGDEDEGVLEPSLMLKRTIPSAGLAVVPKTGHTVNLEEPDAFNRLLERFFADVEHDAWGVRDPRSLATSTTGMDEER